MTNPTTEEMAREVWEFFTGGEMKHLSKCCSKSLSTSIDAWHEHIFPVMSDEQKRNHWSELLEMGVFDDLHEFEATAMHHLTADYNMIKGGK